MAGPALAGGRPAGEVCELGLIYAPCGPWPPPPSPPPVPRRTPRIPHSSFHHPVL